MHRWGEIWRERVGLLHAKFHPPSVQRVASVWRQTSKSPPNISKSVAMLPVIIRGRRFPFTRGNSNAIVNTNSNLLAVNEQQETFCFLVESWTFLIICSVWRPHQTGTSWPIVHVDLGPIHLYCDVIRTDLWIIWKVMMIFFRSANAKIVQHSCVLCSINCVNQLKCF